MKTKSLFIRGIKFVCIVILLLYTVAAFSQNEIGGVRADSLYNILQKVKTPEEKLTVLKELIAINRQQKVEGALGRENVDIAMQTDSFPLVYDAVTELGSYYYILDTMTLKMQMLRRSGQLKEAIQVYKKILEMNAAVNNKAFDRQMAQLRVLNDLNDGEKRTRELEHQNAQIVSRQRLLTHILATIGVLLVLVFLLYRLYCRTRRLKNELLFEKDSLVESAKQLRIIKEKAVEANRLKTVFISNISHEIRTPLNAIVGFSELLVDNSFPEEEKTTFAVIINHSSELLMNLINDVLDLSRLESGNYNFTIREWDVVMLCRELVASLEEKAMPGVKLGYTFPVESFLLNTDRYRLQQLLGHLLSNALKFTIEGEVNLKFEIDREHNAVCFIVADTGCGIPVEMYDKIFERFEKLDDFKQGTGLGLPICRNIASRFGGSLYLDPSYGKESKGACFVFIHPCGLENSKD